MKLPRDLTGVELVKVLGKLGYRASRQTGSHMRLTCPTPNEHHITIPNHDPLRVGTLAAILQEVATHHRKTKDELIRQLFG